MFSFNCHRPNWNVRWSYHSLALALLISEAELLYCDRS